MIPKRHHTQIFVVMAMIFFFSLSGCNFSERQGNVCPESKTLYGSMWIGVKNAKQTGDNQYTMSYKDEHTEDGPETLADIILSGLLDLFSSYIVNALDPVILQVPDDVTNITATYNDYGGNSGNMVVTPMNSVPVTPGESIYPENGYRLVVIEFPEGFELPENSEDAHWYEISVQADVGEARDISVKGICTMKVTGDGTDYYLPVLPAVTDFSEVPSFTVPLSAEGPQAIADFPALEDLPDTPDTITYDFAGGGAEGDEDGVCFIRSIF